MRAYLDDLEQFVGHVREQLGREPRPRDVDHLHIRGFLARLHRQGLKKSSAARKLASLRTFFRYLCREGVLEANPVRPILSPRLEKRIPVHPGALVAGSVTENRHDALCPAAVSPDGRIAAFNWNFCALFRPQESMVVKGHSDIVQSGNVSDSMLDDVSGLIVPQRQYVGQIFAGSFL